MHPLSVDDLPNDEFISLLRCIDIIDAREMIKGIKIAEFEVLKPEARRKRFNDLKKAAYPRIIKREERALTMADVASILGEDNG